MGLSFRPNLDPPGPLRAGLVLFRALYDAPSPSSPSTNRPAFKAARSCANNGRIRFFTSRSDDARVVSIDAPIIHDLRIMVTHGFRNQTNVPAKIITVMLS